MMIGRRSVANPTVVGFAFLAVLALVSGCASGKSETLSQKLADQQRQVSALERENIELRSRLEEQKTASYLTEKRLKESNDRIADLQGRLQSVEISLGEMKGSLDEAKVPTEKPAAVVPRAMPPSEASVPALIFSRSMPAPSHPFA